MAAAVRPGGWLYVEDSDLASFPGLVQCMELAADCDDLSGDTCLSFAIFKTSVVPSARRCLELPCDAIRDCLSDPI